MRGGPQWPLFFCAEMPPLEGAPGKLLPICKYLFQFLTFIDFGGRLYVLAVERFDC
ncbi:hypothetical protein HMPREF0262_02730 [Clostridium sp. ATCC 29733]|nr:hypothetical protein HMPREF0262_02730 [Clostridium sp. ATCC 29733]